MAKKYIVFQDKEGQIKVVQKVLGFTTKVRDPNGGTLGPFMSVQSAENAIEDAEQRRHNKRREIAKAISDSGVQYVFDTATDDALTIRYQFRIVRTAKVESQPFYIQELTLRGWVPVVNKGSSGPPLFIRSTRKFGSLASAKTELLAIVQKLQEAANRRKKARVLKVIDSRVFELSETSQIAKAS